MDEAALREILECSVCFSTLTRSSKVLPCQHTFCFKCLKRISLTARNVRCPECRIKVRGNIEDLPSNGFLLKILDKTGTPDPVEDPTEDEFNILNSAASYRRRNVSEEIPSDEEEGFSLIDMILIREYVDREESPEERRPNIWTLRRFGSFLGPAERENEESRVSSLATERQEFLNNAKRTFYQMLQQNLAHSGLTINQQVPAGELSEEEKRKSILNQLLLLLHSHQCKKDSAQPNSPPCVIPLCLMMKNVLTHMASCRVGRSCEFAHCNSSKQIISHYHLCSATDCLICTSVTDPLIGLNFENTMIYPSVNVNEVCDTGENVGVESNDYEEIIGKIIENKLFPQNTTTRARNNSNDNEAGPSRKVPRMMEESIRQLGVGPSDARDTHSRGLWLQQNRYERHGPRRSFRNQPPSVIGSQRLTGNLGAPPPRRGTRDFMSIWNEVLRETRERPRIPRRMPPMVDSDGSVLDNYEHALDVSRNIFTSYQSRVQGEAVDSETNTDTD